MKKISFLMLTAVAIVGMLFVSCGSGNDDQDFVGTYGLTMVVDSLGMDDDWFDREFYEQMTGETEEPCIGTLTITDMGNGKLQAHAVVTLSEEAGPQDFFITQGTVDSNGRLVLEDSSLDLQSGFTISWVIDPINPSTTLVFRAVMSLDLGSSVAGYKYTCTAEKFRAE